jgi:Flp pilus assembly protein TadD
MLGWTIAAVLAVSAPATPAAVVPGPDPIPQEQVMAVPAKLHDKVQRILVDGDPAPILRFQRLINFVLDEQGLGMHYQDDATHTVAEAYAMHEANCLTFTLLVLALAKEAGLEAYPQEVGETLSWREIGGTIYRDNHINAGVSIGSHRYTIDPAADLVLLPRPPVRVSHERLLAHYYNNIAVDRLQAGHMADALADMDKALSLDSGYATFWSNAGVIHAHAGDEAAAERDYQHALELDPRDASALFNMLQLLHARHDPREAEYRQRLARIEQRDPLQQFMQALDYQRSGDLARALSSMRRAIQLKSDEPRFYAALARLYERMGDAARARSALASAQSHSGGKERERYRAERERLEQAARHPAPDPAQP